MSKDYPLTTRTQALGLYLDGALMPSIAARLLVPVSTLKSWSHEEQWADKRRALKAELVEQSDFDLQRFQSSKRLAIVAKQCTLLEALHERIEAALTVGKQGNWTSSEWLKEISGAIKSAHDISKSLVGLKDASAPGQVNANVQINSMVQYGAGARPIKTLEVVEVKSLPPSVPDPF
jgi:hypothetical protein